MLDPPSVAHATGMLVLVLVLVTAAAPVVAGHSVDAILVPTVSHAAHRNVARHSPATPSTSTQTQPTSTGTTALGREHLRRHRRAVDPFGLPARRSR